MMKSETHFIYIKNKISIYFINIGKYYKLLIDFLKIFFYKS